MDGLDGWDPMKDDYQNPRINSYREGVGQDLQSRDSGDTQSDRPRQRGESICLYVKNIPLDVDETVLTNMFVQHGKVVGVKIVESAEKNAKYGSKIGFVTMDNFKGAQTAIEKLDGFQLKSQHLRVSKKISKEEQMRQKETRERAAQYLEMFTTGPQSADADTGHSSERTETGAARHNGPRGDAAASGGNLKVTVQNGSVRQVLDSPSVGKSRAAGPGGAGSAQKLGAHGRGSSSHGNPLYSPSVIGSDDGLNICATCQRPAHQRCQACKSVYYCNAACQTSHWGMHRKVCVYEQKAPVRRAILPSPDFENMDVSVGENFVNNNKEYLKEWLQASEVKSQHSGSSEDRALTTRPKFHSAPVNSPDKRANQTPNGRPNQQRSSQGNDPREKNGSGPEAANNVRANRNSQQLDHVPLDNRRPSPRKQDGGNQDGQQFDNRRPGPRKQEGDNRSGQQSDQAPRENTRPSPRKQEGGNQDGQPVENRRPGPRKQEGGYESDRQFDQAPLENTRPSPRKQEGGSQGGKQFDNRRPGPRKQEGGYESDRQFDRTPLENRRSGPRKQEDGYQGRQQKPEGGYQGNQQKQEGGYQGNQQKQEGGYQGRQQKPEGGYQGNQQKQEGGYQGNQQKQEGGYQGNQQKQEGGYQGRQQKQEGGHQGRQQKQEGGYQGSQQKQEGGYQGRQQKQEGGYQGGPQQRRGDSGGSDGQQRSGQRGPGMDPQQQSDRNKGSSRKQDQGQSFREQEGGNRSQPQPKEPVSGGAGLLPDPVWPLNQPVVVSVSHIDSPQSFWVQDLNSQAIFVILDEGLKKFSEGLKPAKVAHVGMKCMSQFAGEFARAEVTHVSGDNVKIFYIDYGNSEDSEISNLRPLPAEIANIPAVGKHCYLPVMPASGKDWSVEAIERMRELFSATTLCTVTPLRQTAPVLEVSLVNNTNGIDAAQILIKSGMAKRSSESPVYPPASASQRRVEEEQKRGPPGKGVRETQREVRGAAAHGQRKGPSSSAEKAGPAAIPPQASAPQCALPSPGLPLQLNQQTTVIVTYIDSPQSFWVQDVAVCQDTAVELNRVISEYIESGSPTKAAGIGKKFLCKFMGELARVEVLAVSGQKVKVFYMDYGNSEDSEISMLQPIPAEIAELPAMGSHCSLQVVPAAGAEWSAEGIDMMKQQFENTACDLTALRHTGRVTEVLMVGTANGIDAAHMLIENGAAVTSPPSKAQQCLSPQRASEKEGLKRASGTSPQAQRGSNEGPAQRGAASPGQCAAAAAAAPPLSPAPAVVFPVAVVAPTATASAAPSALLGPGPVLQLNREITVILSYLDNPQSFWVQDFEQCLDTMNALAQEIHPDGQRPASSARVGQKNMCEFNGCKARVEVLAVSGQNVKVFYMDYGNCEDTVISNLLPIPKEIAELPAMGSHCSLQLVPVTGGEWSVEAIATMKEHFKEETAFNLTPLRHAGHVTEVSLVTLEGLDATSFLQDKGLGKTPQVIRVMAADVERTKDKMTEGQRIGLVICESTSPADIYTRIASLELPFAEFSLEMTAHYTDKPQAPYTPVVGELVVGQFTMDNSWYRGEVREVDSDKKEALLFYVDFGNEDLLPFNLIRAITAQHAAFPIHGFHSAIGGICPPSGGVWSDESLDVYSKCLPKYLQDGNQCAAVIKNVQPTLVCLDMVSDSLQLSLAEDLSQQLDFSRLPQPMLPQVLSASTSRPPPLSPPQAPAAAVAAAAPPVSLDTALLALGQWVVCGIQEIVSCQKFYVTLKEKEDELNGLRERLNALCGGDGPQPAAVPEGSAQEGDVVLVKFSEDQEWYRGRLEAINTPHCTVFFIDYGNTEDKDLSSLKILPSAFRQMPAQAICCKLAGVPPPVPQDVEMTFKKRCSQTEVSIKPMGKQEDGYFVEVKTADERSLTAVLGLQSGRKAAQPKPDADLDQAVPDGAAAPKPMSEEMRDILRQKRELEAKLAALGFSER